jgi:hypothetical protein
MNLRITDFWSFIQVAVLTNGPELLQLFKTLYRRIAQRLNGVPILCLCLPLNAGQRNAFHLRFPL